MKKKSYTGHSKEQTVARMDDVCAICLNPLDMEHTSPLQCGHNFHSRCIIAWFQHSNIGSCPLCRHSGNSSDSHKITVRTIHPDYARLLRNYQGRRNRVCNRDSAMRDARDRIRLAAYELKEAVSASHSIHAHLMSDATLQNASDKVRRLRRSMQTLQAQFTSLTESHIGPAPQAFEYTLHVNLPPSGMPMWGVTSDADDTLSAVTYNRSDRTYR